MSAADCSRRWRERHPEETNRISRDGQRRARIEALTHYSGGTPKCACCGETHIEFLAIDHIAGGGNRHRESIGMGKGRGGSLAFWLRKNGYPEGYRVLCHNCNMAIGHYGYCPHHAEAKA